MKTMSQAELETLWLKILALPEPEQSLLIGAAQMAVTLNELKKPA